MQGRFSCVRLFVTPWTMAHQAPLSMGFSRQEYWSGLPFPSPGNLPYPGIKPTSLESPALVGEFFTTSATWHCHKCIQNIITESKDLDIYTKYREGKLCIEGGLSLSLSNLNTLKMLHIQKKNPGQQIIYLCKVIFCWAVYERVINKAYRKNLQDKSCSQKCLSNFGFFLKIFILLANTEHLLIKLLLELFPCAWDLDSSVSCLLQVMNL